MHAVPHREYENVSVVPLYQDEIEDVSVQYWSANSSIHLDSENGLEVLVLSGSFLEGDDQLESQSWIRLPPKSSLSAKTGSNGSKVWVKRNHLKNVDQQINRVSNFN